jgi:acetoacetyl-CoA synthetase
MPMQEKQMPSDHAADAPLWRPDAAALPQTALARFMKSVGVVGGYRDMWRWSVENKEKFWSAVWDFCGVIGEKGGQVFESGGRFQDGRFFPQARLNFAENLLRRRDAAPAVVFRGENRVEKRLSHAELYAQVSRTAQALRAAGVQKGDRVAGFLPNMPEALVAMLATASLGAVWSSASPDFGVQGVLDRFGQIEPKVLFAVDGYWYAGKKMNCAEKIAGMVAGLPTLKKTVVVSYAGSASDVASLPVTSFDDFLAPFAAGDIAFERAEFNHPLYIMFSSGTTGIPKCIVHGAGGTLLQHLKEHRLHCDVRRDDRVFYFSTCGWMMWNWLVSALACEAALMLYDGSPFYPNGYALFEYAAAEQFTLFGTSAKYIDALRQYDIRVADRPGLSSVRMITSTGSPLSHEGFDYVYDAIFPRAQLASISGGTDIVSCFVLGNPVSPVYRGEIQGPGLGMDVDVFDEQGKPMKEGKGELVCKTPFPSMPVGFWNDPQGEKYDAAYFSRFDNIWCHGDWCEWTAHQGLIIHGRSDATLNPGGVRIGTAEIYRVVERIPGVRESIVVGQDWEGDVRVVLFVVMHEGKTLDRELVQEIRNAIRAQASPRHVPAKIVAVADIPRTKSGKITELAVRDVIHGRAVKNVEALANPEALELYKNIADLQS